MEMRMQKSHKAINASAGTKNALNNSCKAKTKHLITSQVLVF